MIDTRGRADVTLASMRQWRDCRETQERRATLIEALSIARGNKSHAAKLLGLSRQHLHRILLDPSRHGLPDDRVSPRVTPVTEGDGEPDVSRRAAVGAVTRSAYRSLTYAVARPTLVAVSTQQAAAIDDGVTVTLVLPRHCVEWLDLESIKRKHALGHGKSSKAPIVVELIEREIARKGDTASRKKGTGGT